MYLVFPRFAGGRLQAVSRWRSGLPPGLGEAAQEAIRSAAPEQVVAFRHRGLAFARTGEQTHRVVARLESGREFSAIYRLSPTAPTPNSRLDAALRVSVAAFEMTERVVLSSAKGTAISPFMPAVLFFEATSEALHYVVEEVNGELPTGKLVSRAASRLPAFHQALREWAETTQPRLATRHDHYFAVVSDAIAETLRVTNDRSAGVLLDDWEAVVRLHAPPVIADHDRQPIHGDLHRWNVFLTSDEPGIKVIDWDSVAWGDPFIDLATLLIDENANDQKRGLAAFAAASDSVQDPAEMERLYLVSRFQVSLLWSCLIASGRWRLRKALAVRRYLDEAVRLLQVLN